MDIKNFEHYIFAGLKVTPGKFDSFKVVPYQEWTEDKSVCLNLLEDLKRKIENE